MSTAGLERLASPRFGRRATDDRAPCLRGRLQPAVEPDGAAVDVVVDLFGAVRPCDGAGAAPTRRGPAQLDARATATAWIVSEGLEQLGPARRQSILDGWRAHHQARVGPLVGDGGCEVRIGGVSVTGALRLALLRWLPLDRIDLAVCEGGLFADAPARALTLLIRPPLVWPAIEAATAGRHFPPGPRFEPGRFLELERYARGRVRGTQLAALRVTASRLVAQLPAAGLPVASATVAAGCAVVADDDAWCASVAARLLARYAASDWVAREASAGLTA